MPIDWSDVQYRGDASDVQELFETYRVGDYLSAFEENRRHLDQGVPLARLPVEFLRPVGLVGHVGEETSVVNPPDEVALAVLEEMEVVQGHVDPRPVGEVFPDVAQDVRQLQGVAQGHRVVMGAGGVGPAQASGRRYGNSRTSRMDGESVNSMTRRSMPTPSPAAGGMPYSSARM